MTFEDWKHQNFIRDNTQYANLAGFAWNTAIGEAVRILERGCNEYGELTPQEYARVVDQVRALRANY